MDTTERSDELPVPFLLENLPEAGEKRRPLLPWVGEARRQVRIDDRDGPFALDELRRKPSCAACEASENENENEVAEPSVGDVAAVTRRAHVSVPGAPELTFATLLERHRPGICPEIPLALLIAFSVREGSFDDATHGSPKSGYGSPAFYELGMFQTPAGLHGACSGPSAKTCEHPPPGIEQPSDPSPWARWCKALGRDPADWRSPTTQVMVGLHDLEHGAAAVRRQHAELFPTRGSDWDLRAAVLLAFAGGAGYASKWLTRLRSTLALVPDAHRWEAFREAVRAEGTARDRSLVANVDAKMALAARVDGATLLAGAVTPAPAARPAVSTTAVPPDHRTDLPVAVVMPWILAGERDVDKLTDRLFFAQHPERSGKPIGAHERALAAEWNATRQRVRTLVETFPPPFATGPATAGAAHDGGISRAEVRELMRAATKTSPRLPGITLAALVERHRPTICPEIPLRVLIAFSALEGSFEDATHGTARDKARVSGKLLPAPFTTPSFYELGVFQTPAGQHGTCTSGHARDCEHPPPGLDPEGRSSWFRGCRHFGRDPLDWQDPTTQVLVGLRDIEGNATNVRGHRAVRDLFAKPGTDWDLRVAVLMAFAGGPGWAVRWLTAEHDELASVREAERWARLTHAITATGRDNDRKWLANVERKMALADAVTDAELLGSSATPTREREAPDEDTEEEDETRVKATYNRAAAVAYAREHAFRPCSDGFMFLDTHHTRVGEYVTVPDGATLVRDTNADPDAASSDHMVTAAGAPVTLSDGTPLTSHEMDDCTHFISCCIGLPPHGTGGGIPVPTNMWGNPKEGNPYGISRVSTMIEFLKRRKFVRVVANKTDDETRIGSLEPGDIIAYFNKAAGEYTHLALYLGDGKIATHTVSRLDEEWPLGRGTFLWTLLHFVA